LDKEVIKDTPIVLSKANIKMILLSLFSQESPHVLLSVRKVTDFVDRHYLKERPDLFQLLRN